MKRTLLALSLLTTLGSACAGLGKFGKAAGPLNPKGSTVSANVQFDGKQPIKVRYVLTYRDGKVVSETWQIDPKLVLTGY